MRRYTLEEYKNIVGLIRNDTMERIVTYGY